MDHRTARFDSRVIRAEFKGDAPDYALLLLFYRASRSPGIDVTRTLWDRGWTRREGRRGFAVWVDPAGA